MHMLGPHKPSAALVVATAALIVALAGTAYAAVRLAPNSVGTKQLRNGAVTTTKLATGAVTKAKLNVAGVTVPDAQHASIADHASSATQAATVGGHSFAQIDATAGSFDPATLLSGFGGLTLRCVGPSGSAGTVMLQVVNASSTTALFAASAVDGSNSAHFQQGPVEPAVGSTPTTTTFSFPVSSGAEVTFGYKRTTGSRPEVVSGDFTLTLDDGCSAFGNAEAS
jgi:hypothetical protein